MKREAKEAWVRARTALRSDLSVVLTSDRDPTGRPCNYVVIYACYGVEAIAVWPPCELRSSPGGCGFYSDLQPHD